MIAEDVSLPLVDSIEVRQLRSTVRAVAAPYGHEYFVRTAKEGKSPTALWADLGAAGLLGVAIEERYGGGGGTLADLAVVTEELASVGLPLMLLALSPAVCASILTSVGTVAQKEAWLPGLASGEKIMAFAITEPDAGSNTHNIRTSARRTSNGWRIDGAKHYVSHVDNADAMLVVARTGASDAGGRGSLSLFIVDVTAAGVARSVIPVEITSPERQFTVTFDGVELPDTSLVGGEEAGLAALFAGLNPERVGSAALLCGIGRYTLDKAVRYARERAVWGVPIGTHQAIAHPLAKAHLEVEAARLLTARAAALSVAGRPAGSAANMAKLAAADAAAHALDVAIQTHGGNGMATEYGLSTLSGLVRLFRIAPVSSEMALNHIAHHDLGLPKSY